MEISAPPKTRNGEARARPLSEQLSIPGSGASPTLHHFAYSPFTQQTPLMRGLVASKFSRTVRLLSGAAVRWISPVRSFCSKADHKFSRFDPAIDSNRLGRHRGPQLTALLRLRDLFSNVAASRPGAASASATGEHQQ